ncbi:MAG: ABC transporter permease [Myxococcales bacterium]|nr:ABC transporter permease [Myxococcales bacterium]
MWARHRVWRRLLYLVPTLFGVTLLAFVLLELVPGDPLSEEALRSRHGLSEEARAELRRARGENLPLFFNLAPLDRLVLMRQVLWSSDETLRRRLNTRLLPQLSFLARLDIAADLALRRAHEILRRRGLVASDEELRDWPRLKRRLFGRATIAAMIEGLRRDDTYDAALRRLRRIGAIANAPLIHALEQTASPAIARALADLNRRPYRFSARDSGTRKRWAIERWRRFAEEEQAMLTTLSSLGRIARGFSETRYGRWIAGVVHLDLGSSPSERVPVTALLRRHLPTTLLLGSLALVLAYLLGIPLGTLQARYADRLPGALIAAFLVVLFALPSYWVATVALQGFSGALGWFPSGGLPRAADGASFVHRAASWTRHLILPVSVLSYGLLVVISRYWSTSLRDELDSPYVRTARAKGCDPTRTLVRHAARNALGTSISLFGILVPSILGGAVIVERLFDLPGMGWLTVRAIEQRDFPTLLAVVALSAVVTILALTLAEGLQLLADPRQRQHDGGRR